MASKVCRAFGALVLLSLLVIGSAALTAADQRLLNGGFEQGSTAWAGIGFSTTGCPALSGAAAGNLTTTASAQTASAEQRVAGVIGPGVYTLTGLARVTSGSPSASVFFSWRNAAGADLGSSSQPLTPSSAYAPFSLTAAAPLSATGLVVRFISSVSVAGNSTLCLDDLSLDAPAPPAPTATSTQTATPTAIPTATPSPTPSPTSTAPAAVSTPTATATAPPSQTSVIGATATATVSAGTPTPVSALSTSLQFVNGGFEEGLRGWYRYGGDLQAVGVPARSGSAGALSSASTATKWAYQVVTIDPARGYEFAGFVRAGAGVRSSYLRISWYETLDGSGQAISTDDSLVKPSNTGDAFLFLSTGAIAPPATARSARLRVMLAPESAVATVVYLDDFSFVTTTVPSRQANKTADPDEPFELPPLLPTATPRPTETAVPTSTPAIEAPALTIALTPGATPKALSTLPRSPVRLTGTPTPPAAEVGGVRIEVTLVTKPALPESLPLIDARPSENHVGSLWLVAAGVLVLSLVGAYFAARRHSD